MKNVLLVAALCVVTAAGLLTWRAHRQAAEAHAQLLSLHASRPLTEEKLRTATARLAETEHSAADLRTRLKTTHAPAPQKGPPPPAPPAARPDPTRLIADHPQLQLLQSAARRAQLTITYGPFYRAAGLTAEQIAAFERNLLNREERQHDIFATANAHQTSLSDPAYQKLYTDLETDYQAAQRAALGDAAAQQLAAFEGTAPTREIVSGLAGAAAMAGLPLDTAQAEQLTRAIATATRPPEATDGIALAASVDWAAVHESAKTFLTPAQLTFIETTEASGPRGMGGRFLPALQAAISAAAREEAAAATPANP